MSSAASRRPTCERRLGIDAEERTFMAASSFDRGTTPERQPRLATLAHFIVRHRRAVIGVWVVLTVFGAFSAGQVSKRWFESFSIPGYSSYEANPRTLQTFGTGEQ